MKTKKLLLTLALLLGVVGGANSVKAEKESSDFSEIAGAGTNATWDAENHAMSWSSGSYNYLSYFMIDGIDATDGYYDLSLWETITITFTLTGTNDGIRVRMKDNTGGDGDWVILSSEGEHNISITDFKKGGVALNYSKIAGIQLSGGTSTTGTSTATFTEISISCTDRTAKARTSLNDLITLAEKQHSFGKTEASFSNLTSEIATAKAVRDNGSATLDALVSAKTSLQAKIDALQLLPGYTNLTLDMYKTWEVKDGEIVEKQAGPGVIHLFEALNGGDVPYGHMYGSGNWENFAELSNYTKLYVTGTAGESIRGYFSKSPEGTGTIDKTITFNAQGVAEFDFAEGDGFSSADYIHLIFLKCPSANSGITSLLLYDGKIDLKEAVELAGKQNSFAKTDDSFAALGTAVSAANAVIDNRTATTAQISEARTNVLNAISGFELQDGYTNLTTDMFKQWDSNTLPTTGSSAGCAYVLNESTGLPYGDGNAYYLNFADLSEYSAMHILATDGTPRIMMNRQVPLEPGAEGYDANGGAYVQITDAPVEGKVTVDLTAYDYAHLNAIKGANWANVTVTGMYLYRTIAVGSAGYATFGSLTKSAKPNGVKAYAAVYNSGTQKLVLTEVTNVPAGKGVIIEAAEGSYAPTFDVAADDITSDLKVSNGTVTGDGSTIFVLNKVDGNVGFYKLASGQKLEAGKAYLKIDGGISGARGIKMVYSDNVTGVNELKAQKLDAKGVYYNLSGQRVSKPTKGLYIVEGKVVKF